MTQIGFGLTLDQVAKNFVRTNRARHSVERQQLQALRNIGSYATRVAQNSIRTVGKFGKSSVPGKPPKSRAGTLKQLIRFAYFQKLTGGTMIAGPVAVHVTSPLVPRGKTIPQVLEEGGAATLTRPVAIRANSIRDDSVRRSAIAAEKRRRGLNSRDRDADGRFRKLDKRKLVTGQSRVYLQPGVYPIAARPFMAPAYAKTLTRPNMQKWFSTLARLK